MVDQEVETIVDTSTPPPAAEVVAPEPTIEPLKEVSTKEAIEAVAEKVQEKRGTKPPKTTDLPPAPAFSPNLKYKVMDKEHEIPKEFAGLIKDADSEKKVREIFERSTGLDTVKENLSQARTERDTARKQHAEISGGIQELRSIYQEATTSGDMHKLDQFFKKLDIPQDVVLQYALAKVQLQEMPPEQRNALVAKQNAEMQAEEFKRQQAQMSQGYLQQHQQMKRLMLESAYSRPENLLAAEDFDSRIGKPGLFKETVRSWGEQEYFRSNGQIDLSPDQAIAAVIKHFGLKTTSEAPAAPVVPQQSSDPRKNVIVKPAGTIPNLGGGGSTSPLKSKPKNLEELKAMASRAANGEAV